MKSRTRFVLFGAWLVGATSVLSIVWIRNPQIIPPPPDFFMYWLIDLYGSINGEQLADLEELYVLVSSFCMVLLVTGFAWLAWRYIRQTLAARSRR